MKNEVIIQTPDEGFWEQYAVLWNNSSEKSPFQAPGILQFFSASSNSEVIAVKLINAGKLKAAILLKKDHGVYRFLSDLKTDVNFFVFCSDCTEDEICFFFCSFLDIVDKNGWAVMLNNVPSWAGYLPLLEKCGSKSKVFWQNLHYSVSPAIVADTPEQLLKMVDRNRKHRYYFNRLTKQLNAEFEVLENNEDMEGWANEFCNTHIKRWEKTVTPSYFKNKAYQQFLLGCLQAWQKDSVLVRFAIKVNQQRIGFSISLLDQHSLIGHSTTYDPDFEKYSPGKSLILPMAKWITEKRLTKFDFGDGNEKYKYLFINKEQVLNRIMVSGKKNIGFILKAKSIRMVRNNAYLYKLYRNTFKKMLAP